MGIEGKDGHHEDVFDSLQGASSVTLLKKISIAAVAIALVAFFLFWSHSSSGDEKAATTDTSGAVLRDRIVSLEEDVAKIKEELRKGSPAPYGLNNQDPIKQETLQGADVHEITSTQQPESINLKSLFEEELQSASSTKEVTPEEHEAPLPKETPRKSVPANKVAPKAQSAIKTATYVVKKGDTLSKISHKFYGSSLKWKRIVDANKATLGSNNVLKVGMKLNIPLDE
jgi:LysM repeat protein